MIAALRRIPGPLLVAVVGMVVASAIELVVAMLYALEVTHTQFAVDDSAFNTMFAGSWFATSVLLTVGLAQWMRALSGTARLGIRIALAGAALELVLHVAWLCVAVYDFSAGNSRTVAWWWLQQVIVPAVLLLLAIGLGLATRRWYWLVGGVCVALVTRPPWFLGHALHELFEMTPLQSMVLFNILSLVFSAATLALVVVVARDASPSADAQHPARGLRWVSRALHGQAIAVAVLVTFTLLLEASKTSDLVPLFRSAIVLSMALELACLVVLGLGALSAGRGRGPLPGWLLLASGTVALCLAGRTLLAGFARAVQYFCASDGFRSIWFGAEDNKFVTAISAQVLLACAITGVLVSLAVGARKEGLEALRARMMLRVGIFAALVVGGVTGQLWISELYDLTPLDATILIGSTAALVASWLLAARVVRQGLDGGTSLPAAKLVT